ncbi:helix-turn-helix domain-containing protein [Cyclobacterium salsum]|uniref:helix-turn-helix domain-containing protein n=1 Tax=Cyclobacterium salsum TaxID=2666329 RepID=UPI001390A004|nr:helix-turn-helix domain-containing protein [Cyclobacterium salsum]
MDNNPLQHRFFQHLKTLLPAYKSLVDEVSDILEISTDSAYRRIRGEKMINLEEIKKISQHFKISLDQLMNLNSDAILFHGKLNDQSENRFTSWLEDILKQLEMVNKHQHKHIYFLLKDIPPFYHFYFKELTYFKFFFWMRSILYYERFKNESFDSKINHFEQYDGLIQKILKFYNKTPTTEIWNVESINTTVRQIDSYHEMGIISNIADSQLIYQQLLNLVDHIEKQAELGKKFNPNCGPEPDNAPYRLLVNEFILGDNTFMAEMDDKKITYLNHSVLYFIGSMDPRLNDAMFGNLENLIKKSSMISTVGEKERIRFFKDLRSKIYSSMTRAGLSSTLIPLEQPEDASKTAEK